MGKLVPELDNNPEPDRKLMYDADKALRVRGTKLFMATRGCPYQCTYCFNHAYNALTKGTGEMIRTRSVDSIINEIKEVQKNYFMDRVNIDDDIFLLKPKGWLEEFAEKFPKEIGLPLYCNIRPELVNEKTGYLLKKINCQRAAMGIECGNNEVAKKVLKRNTTNEKIIDAVRILKKNNVKLKIHNLIGLPVKDPLKVDFETLDFNIKLKPHVAGCSILYPYPGTEVSHLAKEMGMFDGNHEKVQISNKSSSNMQFGSKLEQRKITNFHKLFPIIVEWPFLRSSTNFLIKLPLSYLYTWIYFAFYGYKYIVQSSFKGIAKNIIHYMIFYFKYVSRLEKKVKFNTSPKNTNLNIEKEQKYYMN